MFKSVVDNNKKKGSYQLALSDLKRKRTHYIMNSGFIEKYIMVTLQLGTLAGLVYRLGHGVHTLSFAPLRGLLLLPYLILNFLVCGLTGIGIRRETKIGEGFIIHNFSAILIDAQQIGKNFTINQGVSVGPDWRNNGRPTIGDNVYLGSGTKVLGAVTIGNNVVVGANALVERSIPDDCTVVGVPARIIVRGGDSEYLRLKAASGESPRAA
ncbi:MAG: serine acetyltransferase [Gallionellaceae bacterium]|nr:serine acetyltransferase [Gallionellaceae bacterium]